MILLPATAQQAYRDYPEEFKNPLALFDEEVLRLLRQCLKLPVKAGKIEIPYANGQARLPGNMKELRDSQRHRLKNALNDFRNKMSGNVGRVIGQNMLNGVLTLFCDGSSINKRQFLFGGGLLTGTITGLITVSECGIPTGVPTAFPK